MGGASGQRVFLREPGFDMLACCWALYSQRHPFFRHVNWDDLLARRVDPPFRPSLVSGGLAGQGAGGGVGAGLVGLVVEWVGGGWGPRGPLPGRL